MSDTIDLLAEAFRLTSQRDEARQERRLALDLAERLQEQLAEERDTSRAHRQQIILNLDQIKALMLSRDTAYALLRECCPALFDACCTEDGLDSSVGVPLLRKLWQLFPDLEPPPTPES